MGSTTDNKSFLIITHGSFSSGYGPAQELRDLLVRQKNLVGFLEHPFPYSKEMKNSRITIFQDGEKTEYWEGRKIWGPDFFYYIKDFFSTIFFVIKFKKKFDFCIAADNLNSFAGWFLKKLGAVNKLVYWTIDYTPRRFDNYILNEIYHFIDRFCCYHADFLWNSSVRMKEARRKNGVNINRCCREIIIKDGCRFEKIERLPDEQVVPDKLVFMGHLIKLKGLELLIQALPLVLEENPEATLTIIGTGGEEENLKKMAAELGLKDKVIFTGYIEDHADVERIIASCGIALAPYVPDPNSFTFFSEVGKVKVYLACGLPVIITNVPEIAMDIEKERAGFIIDYKKEDLADKINKLLSDRELYFVFRRNAIKLVEGLSWEKVFSRGLQEIEK
ncbi:MAG: glycosyltransferase [Patescibacteria group bacterium]|nr:glycosyltransferase [Patescibacteria group bacterium]MDD5491037.1 glycosyltransferase [Patescibacteria group bacterium]